MKTCDTAEAPARPCSTSPLPPPCGDAAGDDEPVPEVGADGSFFCGDIRAEGLPVGEGIPSEEDLFAGLNCQRGEHATLAGVAPLN